MVNRTYRYAPEKAIAFPFGYGLSYTTFKLTTPENVAACASNVLSSEQWICQLLVQNTGGIRGDAVVTAYFRLHATKKLANERMKE